jgi:hypothetical protein
MAGDMGAPCFHGEVEIEVKVKVDAVEPAGRE